MSLQHRIQRDTPARKRKAKPAKDAPGIGHNAQSLKDFARRIENLDGEIADLNADKSSIYKEAKASGFDVAVLRKVMAYRRACEKRGADTLADEGALFQHYLEEIEGPFPRVRVHARESVDPDTGEITEVSGASSIPAAEPRPAEPAADKGSALNHGDDNAKSAVPAPDNLTIHRRQEQHTEPRHLRAQKTSGVTSRGEQPAPIPEIGSSEAAGTAAETVSTAIDAVAGPVAGSAPATHSTPNEMEMPGFLRRAKA